MRLVCVYMRTYAHCPLILADLCNLELKREPVVQPEVGIDSISETNAVQNKGNRNRLSPSYPQSSKHRKTHQLPSVYADAATDPWPAVQSTPIGRRFTYFIHR